MAEDTPKKTLKSVARDTPLRSRGFLSQPGGPAVQEGGSGDPAEAGTPSQSRGQSRGQSGSKSQSKSRGTRQVSASPAGTPESLVVKPGIRPYTLVDK